MQTYYVLLHIGRYNPDLRGAIIGSLRNAIDVQRDMIAQIDTADRLFFNENALAGVKGVVDQYADKADLHLYVVAIPEQEDIYDFREASLDDFTDVIEVYPNLDSTRIDKINYSFTKKGSTKPQSFNTSHSVNVDKISNIVTPLVDSNTEIKPQVFERPKKLESVESIDPENLIAKELPNKDSVFNALDSAIALDDDSPLAEVVVSHAESNLAIMRTLMSDDLSEVDNINFDEVNAIVYDNVKTSEPALAYVESANSLKAFLERTNEEQDEIRGRYDRTMKAYLEPLFKQMEAEYRAKVPDKTEQLIQQYLQSVEPKYISLKEERESKRKALNDTIMLQFAKTDGSKAAKALMKFLTLKSEIMNSTVRSLNKLKASKEVEPKPNQELSQIEQQRLQLEQTRLDNERQRAELEQQRKELEQQRLAAKQEAEQRQSAIKSQQEDLQAQRKEAEDYVAQQTAELQQMSAELNERLKQEESLVAAQQAQQPQQPQSDEAMKSAAAASVASLTAAGAIKAAENPVHADEIVEENVMPVDLSGEFDDAEPEAPTTSSVDLDDIDMTQDEIAENNESDVMFDDEDEDDAEEKPKKKGSFFKKLSLPAKIGIGVGAVLAILIATFGILALTSKPDTKSTEPKTQQESSAPKEVEPLFSVGDTLTINDAEGDSLDVVLKEFKEDGSAIAEDANKGKWLITYEQMRQYLKQHPEKGQQPKSSSDKAKSDSSKNETTKDETKSDAAKSENKSETKTESNASANATSNKTENADKTKQDNSVHADSDVHQDDETAYQSESGLKN